MKHMANDPACCTARELNRGLPLRHFRSSFLMDTVVVRRLASTLGEESLFECCIFIITFTVLVGPFAADLATLGTLEAEVDFACQAHTCSETRLV